METVKLIKLCLRNGELRNVKASKESFIQTELNDAVTNTAIIN